MYVTTINPNQALAFSQGLQSGATAFPVSMRTNLQGNAVTYSFNPMLAQNPFLSQAYVNPMLSSAAISYSPALTSGMWSFNPALASTAWAYNPIISTGFMHGAGMLGAPIPAASMNPMVGQFTGIQSSTGMVPMRIDLSETNSDVVVAAELPNVNLNDLHLTVTDDSLSISAMAWVGNQATSLFRTIALPTSIKAEQVEATYSNGILEIRAPKADISARRRVRINVAQ